MVLAITRRQILATSGSQFKTVLDRIGWCHRVCGAASWMWLKIPSQHLEKKEQGASPAPKIVSTLFSRKFGFDLDCRVDAACARQGSSRDLDHQTSTFRLSLNPHW
jgi:hypothetical protein